jgi:hypothetical protein
MPELDRADRSQRPEMGFVSLGQYLDANQGTLQSGFDTAQKEAQGLGGQLEQYLGKATAGATASSAASGQPTKPQDAEGYQSAISQAMQARELGRSLGTEAGLAGSERFGKGGEGAFNSALEYAKYGPQFGQLSGYLDKYGPSQVDEQLNAASAEGVKQYKPPAPPPETVPAEHDPNTPPGERRRAIPIAPDPGTPTPNPKPEPKGKR